MVTDWTARFQRGCAGVRGCDDPTCRLCTVIAKLPQPKFRTPLEQAGNVNRDGQAKPRGKRKA